MARRHYRVFLYGKPISEGSIIRYDEQSKKTARREHELMRESPMVMMRAYPSVPVLMATPFHSMREAMAWYEAGIGLFSPKAFHGIAKRLKNGRGWKVVHVNRDFESERQIEKLKLHSIYGEMGMPKPSDLNQMLDYFAKRLHGMPLDELVHAFMEQKRINPNEKNAFSCRAVGLVDAQTDREFQNQWVAGVDPGRPNGDMSVAARGFVTAKGIDFVSFDMVANPFPEAVCNKEKP